MKKETIAITGATGGLGRQIVDNLALKGYDLVFIDRNIEKSKKLANEVIEKYPGINITFVTVDMMNIGSVKEGIEKLATIDFDVLVLNAGVFNVPITKTDIGHSNVFQVNFISPYFLARELVERKKVKKVVAVGSIAHFMTKLDEKDVEFFKKKSQMKIYGNSKRFLMFSLYEYFKNNKDIKFSIAHPGITSTNMTSHYPKWINWFIKIMLKILFNSPKKACKSMVEAIETDCDYFEWIGPRCFNIWGNPKKKKLKIKNKEEIQKIAAIADDLYKSLKTYLYKYEDVSKFIEKK